MLTVFSHLEWLLMWMAYLMFLESDEDEYTHSPGLHKIRVSIIAPEAGMLDVGWTLIAPRPCWISLANM